MNTNAAKTKKPKAEKEPNPLVLNAEVIRGSILHRRLGKIVKVTKSLLTVEWASGGKNLYSRKGSSFLGRADENGEAITERNGRPLEEIWDNEDALSIATEGAKKNIQDEADKKRKRDEERAQARARIEADPAYIQRQADLKRYAEMLQGLGANIENGWNDQKDFRVELDGIPPEKMDALVDAVQKGLAMSEPLTLDQIGKRVILPAAMSLRARGINLMSFEELLAKLKTPVGDLKKSK